MECKCNCPICNDGNHFACNAHCSPAPVDWEERLNTCIEQAYECDKLEHDIWHIASLKIRAKGVISTLLQSERKKVLDEVEELLYGGLPDHHKIIIEIGKTRKALAEMRGKER